MQLRHYQEAAKDAVWNHLQTRTDAPCVVIPTGGGKSPLMAALASEAAGWGKRVILLADRKELLQQNADKIVKYNPQIDIGVYSAGLGMRSTRNQVLVAGIQSIYNRADKVGARDLIIVDEAHTISPEGEGRYGKFLAEMKLIQPKCRLVGLTATPYRMKEGMICAPDHLLNHVCYEIGVKQLIEDGFLCKLISKRGLNLDFSGCHIKAGEYVESEVTAILLPVVAQAIEELLKLSTGRKSILIFCQGIEHAQAVQAGLQERTKEEVGFVSGDTLPGVRAEILDRFKANTTRFLVNVNVLTTGFDAPGIDCVVLLRPTASPGLYYQMVGRAFRTAPGKENALVLDFGGNVERHGPVDIIEASKHSMRGKGEDGEPVTKTCPKCNLIQAVSYLKCPECEHEWPPRELKHEAVSTEKEVLSKPETLEVFQTVYNAHQKRGSDPAVTPQTLRVTYEVGVGEYIEEWLSFEGESWKLKRAKKWWAQRSKDPFPKNAAEAVRAGSSGLLAPTTQITATRGKPFWIVNEYVVGPMPESSASLVAVSDEDVPF